MIFTPLSKKKKYGWIQNPGYYATKVGTCDYRPQDRDLFVIREYYH